MMEEVTTEEQVSDKMEETKIASQLQEAALTDVTQALSPQKEGTPPRTSFAPASTISPPLSTLPPPSELPAHLVSSISSPTSLPTSATSSLGGPTTLPPSVLSSPGGSTTLPPSILSSPGGTTSLPPSVLSSPGGTTTLPPSIMSSPGGVTSTPGIGTLTPSAQVSTGLPSGGAAAVTPPPTGGFVTGRGALSSSLAKQSPVGVGTTSAMFTPSTITTLPSVGSSPSAESSSVLHPSAYPGIQQGAAQYPMAPEMIQTPIEASASIDLQEQSLGPMYPAPSESKQGGLFGWLSGRSIVNKVVEKTKSSVETMITTLDPGMKEVIYSGGDMNVVVTSTKEVKVGAVRQAFQEVFGRATIIGQESQPNIAPQPVGFTAGVKGAEDRIDGLLRQDNFQDRQVVVSMESFIAEVQPDKWFDIGCVLLRDKANNIELQAFTQATPIPLEYVERAQEQTASDYGLRWSGLSVTIGQVLNQQMPYVSPSDWHQHFTGVTRKEMFYLTAKSIAGLYKDRLPYLPPGGSTR